MANPVKIVKGAAKVITTGKAKATAKGMSRKEAKQSDSFVNQYAKFQKKSGSTKNPAQIAPKSVALGLKTPKVPVKKKGKK